MKTVDIKITVDDEIVFASHLDFNENKAIDQDGRTVKNRNLASWIRRTIAIGTMNLNLNPDTDQG